MSLGCRRRAPCRSGGKDHSGLSLAEIVAAVGLMTTLLVVCIGLFTQLLGSSDHTRFQTVAAAFAARRLEQIEIDLNFSTAQGSEGFYTNDEVTRTPFYYLVDVRSVSSDLGAPSGRYLGGRTVQVRVFWNSSSPDQVRPGLGLNSVSLSRFIYPRTQIP